MKYFICDSHTDLITALNESEQIEFFRTLPKNVKMLNCAVFTTDDNLILQDIVKYKQQFDNLQLLTQCKLLFSVEDIASIPLSELDEFITLQPFCCSLTWNYANKYAGGALSTGGLTKEGIKAIEKLESNNIIVDTAHLNRQSFWEFCQFTSKPILNTHCNIDALFPHPRNLTDWQIQKIVDSNGFIGITIYEKFISQGKISAKDIALQFDYLIKNFGYLNFGLGSDLFGINKNSLPSDIKSHSELSLIGDELEKLGYSQQIIECIMYKNYLRFLRLLSNINR